VYKVTPPVAEIFVFLSPFFPPKAPSNDHDETEDEAEENDLVNDESPWQIDKVYTKIIVCEETKLCYFYSCAKYRWVTKENLFLSSQRINNILQAT